MLAQARIRLKGRRERELRREGVIHIRDALRLRVVGDPLRLAEASDPTAVDLDEADAAVVDEIDRHLGAVRSLPSRDPNVRRAGCELAIRPEIVAGERLFQPADLCALERVQPCCGRFDVAPPDLAGVDEQDAVGSQRFPCRCHVVGVSRDFSMTERAPAHLDRPEALVDRCPDVRERVRRLTAEQHRRVGRLAVRRLVPEEGPDRHPAGLAQKIPQCHVDAGVDVGRLEEIHAVASYRRRNAVDVLRGVQLGSEHGCRDGLAHTVRPGRDESGDGRQR